jgi:AraC-like DNA-binding protein
MNRCRIEQAQSFLRDTNWTIPLIAEFVGFKSPSYFHRLFRREVGISPVDYRLHKRESRKNGAES